MKDFLIDVGCGIMLLAAVVTAYIYAAIILDSLGTILHGIIGG